MPSLENFSYLSRRWRRIGKIGVALNRSPATAATRFDPRTAGGGAAAGFTRRGSVLTVVGGEDRLVLRLDWIQGQQGAGLQQDLPAQAVYSR